MALRCFNWQGLGNKQRPQYGLGIQIWGSRDEGTTKRENVGLDSIKYDPLSLEMKSRQAKLGSNKLVRSGVN